MKRLLDTNVRYFDDAVTKNQFLNEFGSMVKVLDEVLVNGSEAIEVSLITTKDDGDYWLSTITTAKPHNYKKDLSVVQIQGASVEAYNSIFRVQSVEGNSFTIAFDKTKTPEKPDDLSNPSGVTVKLPPLGYDKVFSATNKAAYKTKNQRANPCYLRVDDSVHEGYPETGLKRAMVSIYTDMKNIDDYYPRDNRLKAPFLPEDPLMCEEASGKRYGVTKWFYKTRTDSDGLVENRTVSDYTTPFEILGDDRTFYLFVGLRTYSVNGTPRVGYSFGEYESFIDSQYNHMITAQWYQYRIDESRGGWYSDSPGRLSKENSFARSNHRAGKQMLNFLAANGFEERSYDFVWVSAHREVTSGSWGHDKISSRYQVVPFMKPLMFADTGNGWVPAGQVRGLHFILMDLSGYPLKQPNVRDVWDNIHNQPGKKFVILSTSETRSHDTTNAPLAFELNDWR